MFCCLKTVRCFKNDKIGLWRLAANRSGNQWPITGLRQHIQHNTYFSSRLLAKQISLTAAKKWSLVVIGGAIVNVSYFVYHKTRVKCDLSSSDDQIDDSLNQVKQELQIALKCNETQSFDFKRIWHYLRPESLYLMVAIASALIVAFLNIEIPLSIGSVMNVLSRFATEENSKFWSNRFFTEISGPAFKVFELYILQSVFTFAYIYSLAIVGEKTSSRIRSDLFSSIIRLDTDFFDRRKSAEIISRLTSDVQEFKSSFKLCISQGLRSFTQIIGCSISLFVISPKMTLWMATIVPSMVLFGALLGSLLRQISREAQAQTAKAAGIAGEAISNVRTVKALAMEDSQCRVYDKELAKAEEMNIRLGLGIGVLQSGTNLALNSIVLATLLYGGKLLSSDEITAGNLMSFLVATQTIQRSLSQLSLMFGHYIRGVSAATRVFEFIDIRPTVVLNQGITLQNVVGDVHFNNISFSYPTRGEQQVLNGFNLKLTPSTVTAICGLSGEGKSTVASLMERFYDIESGLITIDGVDIKSLDPLWLRQTVIGFINQEPILFGTTIMENIRFGKPDATDEEVLVAAKLANAHTFIEQFPDGYQTLVGERGATVSGGQKQRIAIARALVKNPKILVLDEATSALDAESEALVQEALEKVMQNRTVLVIAHRLSTIQNADTIAVLSQGKVVEMGSHTQLSNKRGLYWNLIRQQLDTNNNN
ncbi:mitochondrial potassium channel ATP-binding subunit-like [Oppia nitens]|uniref:mitochondrial potassium channel ATP-binding subunit-like n=1 Tax=Oppia nitens TaxID=1686743 RepID=UPI0023DB0F34|nr:mitochondrial potassium channel ATP-binding subunit-like [Oppia nitens]